MHLLQRIVDSKSRYQFELKIGSDRKSAWLALIEMSRANCLRHWCCGHILICFYFHSSQYLVPFLLLSSPPVGFEDDKKSSNVSRAHSANSARLTNSLWPNLETWMHKTWHKTIIFGVRNNYLPAWLDYPMFCNFLTWIYNLFTQSCSKV